MFRWFLDLVRFLRFSRTVVTIPFSLGAYVAVSEGGGDLQLFFLVMASIVFGVLSFLFFNRAYNYHLEYQVPRDQERERLFSSLGPRVTWGLTLLSSLSVVIISYNINLLAFYLSPLLLVILFFYVPSRYVTPLNHLSLGTSASLLILGPYVAISGELAPSALAGGGGLLFWIAGFDVIYSLKNVDQDRAQGFHSIPSDYGVQVSFYTAYCFHSLSMFGFFAFGVLSGMTAIYFSGMTLFGLLLIYSYMTAKRRTHIKLVHLFFNLNALLSISFFTLILLERLTKP